MRNTEYGIRDTGLVFGSGLGIRDEGLGVGLEYEGGLGRAFVFF